MLKEALLSGAGGALTSKFIVACELAVGTLEQLLPGVHPHERTLACTWRVPRPLEEIVLCGSGSRARSCATKRLTLLAVTEAVDVDQVLVDLYLMYHTHSIFVGRVRDVRCTEVIAPLLYQDGQFAASTLIRI